MATINKCFLRNRSLLENIIGILTLKFQEKFTDSMSYKFNNDGRKVERNLNSLSRAVKWLKAEDENLTIQSYLDYSADVYRIQENLKEIVKILEFTEEIIIPSGINHDDSELELFRDILKVRQEI